MAEAFKVLGHSGLPAINEKIFGHLSNYEVCQVRSTCKKLRDFIDCSRFFHKRVLYKMLRHLTLTDVMREVCFKAIKNYEEAQKWTDIYKMAEYGNPLEWAVLNGNVFIIEEYYDMVAFRKEEYAAYNHHQFEMRWACPKVLPKRSDGGVPQTLLELAAANNQMEIAKVIVTKGDLGYKNIGGSHCPLINCVVAAARNDHYNMVQYLMSALAITFDLRERRYRLLCAAASSGNLRMFKYFGRDFGQGAMKKIQMNPYCSFEETCPLQIACANGFMDIVQYLIDSCKIPIKAIVHRRLARAFSALCLATIHGHLDVVKYLLNHPDVIDNKMGYIKRPSHYNARYSLLNIAVRYNQLEIMNYLLLEVNDKNGSISDILHMCYDQDMPIHAAVRNENIDIINVLLPLYEDKNINNAKRQTVMAVAASTGNFGLIKMLAEVNMQAAQK